MITELPKKRIPERTDRFFQILEGVPKHLYQLPGLLIFVIVIIGEVYDILIWVILFVIVLVISGMIFSERIIWQKKWREFAKETNLEFQLYKSKRIQIFNWPRITGIYKGRQMKMERVSLGLGRREEIFTTIICTLKKVTTEIVIITPQSWHLSSKMNNHHYSDLELTRLGNEKLDKLLRIKSSRDEIVGELFPSKSMKIGLQELLSQAPDMEIVIQGRELNYRERSNIMDIEYFVALSGFLGEIANYFERIEFEMDIKIGD